MSVIGFASFVLLYHILIIWSYSLSTGSWSMLLPDQTWVYNLKIICLSPSIVIIFSWIATLISSQCFRDNSPLSVAVDKVFCTFILSNLDLDAICLLDML